MGNRETMHELISQAYAARGRGDLEELMTAFHPDYLTNPSFGRRGRSIVVRC